MRVFFEESEQPAGGDPVETYTHVLTDETELDYAALLV